MRSRVNDTSRLDALERTGLLDSPREQAFDRLTALARELLDAKISLVSLVGSDRQFFKSDAGLGEPLASDRGTPLSHSFCVNVVESDAPFVVGDAREHPLVRDNPAIPDHDVIAYAGVPLRSPSGEVLGSFCVIDHQPRVWDPREVRLLSALADSVMTEIALVEANRQLEHSAMHDGLTGLPNRRLLDDRLSRGLARCRRRSEDMALMFLDLDGFKAVNDRLGHAAGDRVLVEVSRRLTTVVRPGDTVARYGGDEFVVLCESVGGLADAVEILQRLERTAEAPMDVDAGEPVKVGLSAGLILCDGADRPEDLLRAADTAMYEMKRSRRSKGG
jgi:diguanylate cyclase (GGDEF)-like protein